jgi:ABC-2 type transport system permease protein
MLGTTVTVLIAIPLGISLGMTLVFLGACTAVVAWMFRTGYRLKN